MWPPGTSQTRTTRPRPRLAPVCGQVPERRVSFSGVGDAVGAVRRGTGYVRPGELPDSEEEVSTPSPKRKATSVVQIEDLPDSDAEYEEDFEELRMWSPVERGPNGITYCI